MDINRVASEQLIQVSTTKLSNDQVKAEGEAALKLIQSVPQPTGNTGHNINIAV